MIVCTEFTMRDKVPANNWWGWEWKYKDTAAMFAASGKFASGCGHGLVAINSVYTGGCRTPDNMPHWTVLVWHQEKLT